MRLIAIATLLLLTACTASQQATTRTALDTIGKVVDPAYELAATGCKARAAEIVAKANELGFKDAYQDELSATRERCAKTEGAFAAIRILHEQAVGYVESGLVAEAQEVLASLLKAWSQLKESIHGQD